MNDTKHNESARLELAGLENETEPEGVFLPDRDEIERKCADIRSAWSPREHRKRASERKHPRWRPPTIHLDEDRLHYLSH